MDFSWSKKQREQYEQAYSFAQTELSAPVPNEGPVSAFPIEKWNLCGQFGLMGLSLPQAYGGMGLDALTSAHVFEAFGKGCPDRGLLFSAAAHLFAAAMPIAAFGRAELKQQLLPQLAAGARIGANAITEPEAGSDVTAIQTRAEEQGDGYILNGAKSFVTNGPVADVVVTYAVTNPKAGFLGISGFAVEKGTPGMTLGQAFGKMGLTTAQGGWVTFENCCVPKMNRLGQAGEGAAIFRQSMQWERAVLFALYLGMLERQLEKTVAFTQRRKQFGKSLSKHQAVAHRLADMKLRLEQARWLLYRACWALDQGQDATLEIALSKLAVSEAAIQSSMDAVHLHGGEGYKTDGEMEAMLRDAIPATLFSGTSEIQRDLIASRLSL
ncbi:MAG: acyl-CoA dehydrogenase family protein [Anaerolineae bacterium]|nr:acyl-CoA dehydrogenase family protein [Anaerolineae bacterium]